MRSQVVCGHTPSLYIEAISVSVLPESLEECGESYLEFKTCTVVIGRHLDCSSKESEGLLSSEGEFGSKSVRLGS